MVRKDKGPKTDDDLKRFYERIIYDGSETLNIDNSEAEGDPFDLMKPFREDQDESPSGNPEGDKRADK